MKPTEAEMDYMERFMAKEYKPELLFEDTEIVERIQESSDGVVEMQMIEGMLKSWYRTGNYDVIRDFISSILAVISVLVILRRNLYFIK